MLCITEHKMPFALTGKCNEKWSTKVTIATFSEWVEHMEFATKASIKVGMKIRT